MTTIQWHIIRILYVSEPEPDTETYAWNETAPEPRDNKRANISKHIRSYVFVVWFSDLFVALRICSLACLYNLKANRNQFSKYFEVYMILKDDCTERSLLAIEVWSAEVETCNLILFHPPLTIETGRITQGGKLKPCFVGRASPFLQIFFEKYTLYIDKFYSFNFLSPFPFSF